MAETVLITGGAGFIGRRVAKRLLSGGNVVRVLDCFVDQVHGGNRDAGMAGVECVTGDVRDADIVARALRGVDAVVHLAAEVGVGQSMYEVGRYVAANDLGTAILFEQLIARPVRRVVVASSMSIYGEGLYRTAAGEPVEDARRDRQGATAGFELRDRDGLPLTPQPTPEWKRPSLESVYALTKYAQERLTLMLAASYGIEATALRLFNVYGSGQSLSNPYTGVLAIFSSRLLNGQRPVIFEDGEQLRDFVHVDDVARAFELALVAPGAKGQVFNIGSGRHMSVRQVAGRLAAAMGREHLEPEITGRVRAGDIRHCFADIGKARQGLGFTAAHRFDDGIVELVEWVAQQQALDRVATARDELEVRGLVA